MFETLTFTIELEPLVLGPLWFNHEHDAAADVDGELQLSCRRVFVKSKLMIGSLSKSTLKVGVRGEEAAGIEEDLGMLPWCPPPRVLPRLLLCVGVNVNSAIELFFDKLFKICPRCSFTLSHFLFSSLLASSLTSDDDCFSVSLDFINEFFEVVGEEEEEYDDDDVEGKQAKAVEVEA